MNILFHMCCAPCAIYPLSRLLRQGFSPTGFFYNPNIHPFLEFDKRLAAAREFARTAGLPLAVHGGYELEQFLSRTLGAGAGRCERCYRMRLDVAAAEARGRGFTLFTSSLLYSIYQKHDLIRGVAGEMARERGVEFFYEDFRPGWREGIVKSKELGLYRQQYCGCIFSERERYEKKINSAQGDRRQGGACKTAGAGSPDAL